MERAIDIGFSIGCLFPAIINALDNRKTIIPLSAAFDAAFRFCLPRHRFLVVDQIETLAPRVSFNLVRRAGIKRLNPDYSVINKRFEERKNPSDGSAMRIRRSTVAPCGYFDGREPTGESDEDNGGMMHRRSGHAAA